MRLFRCDICGQETTVTGLYTLSVIYTTKDVAHVCKGCLTKLRNKAIEVREKYDQLRVKEIQEYLAVEIRDYKTESA